MICAWESFLRLLPPPMRPVVDRQGKTVLQELRLRVGMRIVLVTMEGERQLDLIATIEDLRYVVNAASRYSPWAAESMSSGYVTAEGGHRIGLCGSAVLQNGNLTGFRSLTSLCVRVARDFPGIARNAEGLNGSILILGRPGSGKTTLLRDLVRNISNRGVGSVAVVDERCEVFPSVSGKPCFEPGRNTDILSGCSKRQGIEMAIRTMGAAWVAVDEISSEADCQAIYNAGWCGVPILATAHASDVSDLMQRPVYKPLVQQQLFRTVLVLQKDKSWKEERLRLCT